jgi:hypothetical protein
VQGHGLDRLVADLDAIHVGIPNYPMMSASMGGHLRGSGATFADLAPQPRRLAHNRDGVVVVTLPVDLQLLRDINWICPSVPAGLGAWVARLRSRPRT